MKITAVVLAAGKGSRMQSDIPKQYMPLCGKPVLYYSMKVFQDSEHIDQIILVTGKDDIEYCKEEIVDKYDLNKVEKIVAGGKERYESVHHALMAISDSDIIMIHDGARPFVTESMIVDSIHAVKEYKACTIAVPAKDTMKKVDDNGFGVETPNRAYMWNVQTPQTFYVDELKSAYEKMIEDDNTAITDDTMIMELYAKKYSKMVMGSYENIKITTPEDMLIAEVYVNKMKKC